VKAGRDLQRRYDLRSSGRKLYIDVVRAWLGNAAYQKSKPAGQPLP
jgi:hypothetical protein